ncbi:MAG: GAF domain-containing protein, partial [Phycisphaerales bacterium]
MELSRIHDFHLLMERILSEARGLTGADAGTIYTREGDALRFAFSQNDTLEAPGRHSSTRFSSLVVPVSPRSIAGYCAMTGASVNVADAYALDPGTPWQFDRSYDAMTGYRTTSVVAVPMRDSSDVVLGVLQLLNARVACHALDVRPRLGGVAHLGHADHAQDDALGDLGALEHHRGHRREVLGEPLVDCAEPARHAFRGAARIEELQHAQHDVARVAHRHRHHAVGAVAGHRVVAAVERVRRTGFHRVGIGHVHRGPGHGAVAGDRPRAHRHHQARE